MAVQTLRTLAQLRQQAKELGLTVKQRGKKESKDDYVYALRDYFIKEKYGSYADMPKSLSLMLQLESPMLASQYKTVKPEKQKEMWESNHWYAEEKCDGNRQLFFFLKDPIFDSFSRNNSVADFLPVSYGNKIYTDHIDFTQIKDQFIIDSEVICANPNISTIMGKKGVITETMLQAVTAILAMNEVDSKRIQKEEDCPLVIMGFDCLWFNGEWLLDKPLIERRKYLKVAMQQLINAGFKATLPKSNMSNKKQFYESIVKGGGEGIILKHIYSKYSATSSRSHRDWVKVKRTFSEAAKNEGLADTIDAFISGYELADDSKSWAGLIGSLELSVYVKRADGTTYQHMIAKVANIEHSLREKMTIKDDKGNPILDPQWYGKVVECDGQDISARALRLTHAILIRFRPDRSQDTCIIEEEFLKSMIL